MEKLKALIELSEVKEYTLFEILRATQIMYDLHLKAYAESLARFVELFTSEQGLTVGDDEKITDIICEAILYTKAFE